MEFANISVMDEASSFKFDVHIRFVKARHEITPIGKSEHGHKLGKLPEIWDCH